LAHIETSPHEVEGHLKFVPGPRDTHEGLQPYWFLTSLLLGEFDGYSRKIETKIDGETWTVSMNYWQTGIAPREQDSINGDRMYGYVVRGDGPGEAKAAFQIEPRWNGMRHYEDGETLNIPWEPDTTGVDADVHSSNVEPDRLPQLLRDLVAALAGDVDKRWNADYFRDPHESSNLYAYERYVRLVTDSGKKLVLQSGAFWRIHHLLAEEKGAKWSFTGDNEEVIGKRHQLKLKPVSAGKLVSHHRYGKQLKHYHMKHVDAQEGATEHPKFGVLVNKSLNGGEAIPWGDRHEVRREIEETIVNVLDWSGVPTDPDADVWVEDDHFSPTESDTKIARVDDPTPQLEAEQQSLLLRTMREVGEGPTELVEKLATDGGTRYDDAAADLGVGTSTIYRWLSDLGDLVSNERGRLDLASEKLRQEVAAIAEQAENSVASAASRVCKLVNMDRDGDESALQRWMNTYAVEIERATDDEAGEVRIDTVLSTLRSRSEPMLSEVLDEGRTAWKRAGFDVAEFDAMRLSADLALSPNPAGAVRNWI
jgi:transposase